MQSPPANIEYGALPRVATCYGDGTFPKYEDIFPLLPRDKWKPVSLNRHVRSIYKQADGMCTSNGACGAMMTERSMRNREHNPVLDPEDLYYQHSKWGQGSTLDENLRALVDTGVAARGTRPQRAAPRAQNKMLEAIDLNADFDAVATALQRGHPCLVGVRWPGGGGHAVCATELVGRPQWGNNWAIRGPNSWGEDWGDPPGYSRNEEGWLDLRKIRKLTGGFYTLTEQQCGDFQTFGCWAAGSST